MLLDVYTIIFCVFFVCVLQASYFLLQILYDKISWRFVFYVQPYCDRMRSVSLYTPDVGLSDLSLRHSV